MRILSVIFLSLFVHLSATAQDKNATATIEVDGVCGMCKNRIEKAALSSKGVKSAVWDMQSHQLSLIFDERKTTTEAIEKNVAAAGHDTANETATEEAYNSIHHCCKYRDTSKH